MYVKQNVNISQYTYKKFECYFFNLLIEKKITYLFSEQNFVFKWQII